MNNIKRLAVILFLFPFSLHAERIKVSTIEGSPVSRICSLILTEIYNEAGFELEVIEMPAVRATVESTEGTISGETHRVLTYGDSHPELIMVPFSYYSVDSVLFTLADHPARFMAPEDLTSYRFAILKGVKKSLELTAGYDKVTEFENSDSLIQFLHMKRADFALLSRLHGLSLVEKHGFENIVVYDPPLEVTQLYHYLHNSQSHLVPLIEETMEELSRSGELDKIIKMAELKVMGSESSSN